MAEEDTDRPAERDAGIRLRARSLSPMRRDAWVGAGYAIAAYGFWGAIPVYWKAVREVSKWEMVAHRVLWALPVMVAIVAWRGRAREVLDAIRDRRHRGLLLATSALVSANWLVFIWAVQDAHVLESSLGYFVVPLLNAVLGVAFLKERLRPLQAAAVVLAAAAVAWLTVSVGAPPWKALALAGTFAAYGFLRKRAGVDGLVGLTVETLFLAPVGAAVAIALLARGDAAFLHRGFRNDALMVASGLVTALPLLWFANAARRLRLTTLGFFQYLSPTGQFLLAVFAYGEPFTHDHAVAFSLLWAAVALYLIETVRLARRPPPVPPPE
jgi:chloramphenicol-sensitive protein RarD